MWILGASPRARHRWRGCGLKLRGQLAPQLCRYFGRPLRLHSGIDDGARHYTTPISRAGPEMGCCESRFGQGRR
jgi:hypothetical protein